MFGLPMLTVVLFVLLLVALLVWGLGHAHGTALLLIVIVVILAVLLGGGA